MNSILKLGLSFLTEKLVVIFDTFKVSSPKVAVFIFSLIAIVIKSSDMIMSYPEVIALLGSYYGFVQSAIYVLGFIFTALTGAHTPQVKKVETVEKGSPIILAPENGSIIDQINKSKIELIALKNDKENDKNSKTKK